MSAPPRRARWVVAVVIVALGVVVPPARADDTGPVGRAGPCWPADQDAVTIVIEYGDLGRPTEQFCASGLTEGTTGAEALRLVGVDVTGSQEAGPAFICRLNGLPGPDQAIGLAANPGYVETCVHNPPAQAYWTYWQAAPGGAWTYALRGYATSPVQLGGFEGYSFAHNQTTTDAVEPTVPPIRPSARGGLEHPEGSAATRPADSAGSAADVSAEASAPTADPSPTAPASAASSPSRGLSTATFLGLAAVVLLGLAGLLISRRRSR